jgi:hypothetical protein
LKEDAFGGLGPPVPAPRSQKQEEYGRRALTGDVREDAGKREYGFFSAE